MAVSLSPRDATVEASVVIIADIGDGYPENVDRNVEIQGCKTGEVNDEWNERVGFTSICRNTSIQCIPFGEYNFSSIPVQESFTKC